MSFARFEYLPFADLVVKKTGGIGEGLPGPAHQNPPPQPQLLKQFPIKGIMPVKNVPHLPDTAETQLSPKVLENP